MWTQDKKARVTAGDVIFLPRKQLHSLEANFPRTALMSSVVICPGDNPSINYYDLKRPPGVAPGLQFRGL